MKIVPQVDGVVYPSLMGLVAYVEFPAVLPRSAILAASRGGATTGLPTDPSLIGIFVGQVPFSLPPGYLAWFVNTLLGEECVQEALMARNQSCGRVVLPVDRAQTVLLLSETALFDSTGVWISRTPEQTQLLAQFCASLGQGQFGSQVLRHALPKKCAVLRLQQRPKQQPPKPPVAHATFSPGGDWNGLLPPSPPLAPPLSFPTHEAAAPVTTTTAQAQHPFSFFPFSPPPSSTPPLHPFLPSPQQQAVLPNSTLPPMPMLPPPPSHFPTPTYIPQYSYAGDVGFAVSYDVLRHPQPHHMAPFGFHSALTDSYSAAMGLNPPVGSFTLPDVSMMLPPPQREGALPPPAMPPSAALHTQHPTAVFQPRME